MFSFLLRTFFGSPLKIEIFWNIKRALGSYLFVTIDGPRENKSGRKYAEKKKNVNWVFMIGTVAYS